MRGLATYLLAGIVVVVAMDMAAPPIGLSLPLSAWPSAKDSLEPVSVQAPVQTVDRTNKGDRLDTHGSHFGANPPASPPHAPTACEPAYSPLSAAASAPAQHFAGRCVA